VTPATALVLAVVGAYGVHLVYSALALGWTGVGPGPRVARARARPGRGVRDWLAQAGLDDVPPVEFGAVVAVLVVLGAAFGFAIFGSVVPAVCLGAFAGSFPIAAYRNRRRVRRAIAQEAWPRMIEEIRILTRSLGRSVPQALFEVGGRGPEELRPAFAAAHREWLISTDFARTVRVLKDRTQDVQGRKDARAKQAGVRFARRFVLIVPLGMAAAGVSVGEGRAAYQTPGGQLAVVIGIALTVACWWWAGTIMRIPEEERVFER